MSVCGHPEKPCVNDADMAGSLRADVCVRSCIFTFPRAVQLTFCVLSSHAVVVNRVSLAHFDQPARYVMWAK